MFSFGKKSTRAGIRAALLAGATVAAVALSAGSASASLSCTGNSIIGEGSSLQKKAQLEVWNPGFHTEICNEEGKEPTVEYKPEGSGAGLKAWNFDNVNKTINTARQFIGTDDAPTTAQIKNVTTITAGGASKGAKVLTIPVTQTSIAIMANPPEGCTVTAIANVDLEKVFNGSLLKWSQLETAKGGAACESPITRAVRFDSSGTTLQFKNYLMKVNTKPLACTTGEKEGKAIWKELEPTGTPNLTWPESCKVGEEEITLSEVKRPAAKGGGELTKYVKEHTGTIGYAALPDAKGGTAAILSLQNNGKLKGLKATFVNPAKGTSANCSKTVYNVPGAARPSEEKLTAGLNSSWATVFGAKTNTSKSGGGYPLCTLTYVEAFHGYQKAGFPEADEVTVNDYVTEYLVQATGQEKIDNSEKYYAALPESAEAAHDVLGAAQFAASKISY
jgi:ABC-type phosphate transport system substrate-binding protein